MKKTIILLFIFLLLVSTGAFADRGSIPFIEGVQIFEPAQDALIAWNGDEEILILSTELYASKATKVLQVLPLPAEPEVKKSSRDVLRRANEFVFQEVFNDLRQPVLRSTETKAPAAEIKEEIVIGSHDITVVKVLNQNYFVSWVNDYLQEKGEQNPVIPRELKNTINNYVNRGYNYFVFDTVEVGPDPKINEAVSYQFKTDELYYPLEITKSDRGISEISLLILTDQNLVNYNGINKNQITEMTPAVNLTYGESAYISTSIAELFIDDIDQLKQETKDIKLLNWVIKDDLANFNQDLLVDQNLGALLENKIVYQGTTYLDYRVDQDYPYQSKKTIETIEGKVEMRMGSRMYPWMAPSVKGHVLFNASGGNLLTNFAAEGKSVKIKGYRSKSANISMRDPIDRMPVMVEIKNVFYVTEIVGWKPYSGIALSSEGNLNNSRTRFWLEDK